MRFSSLFAPTLREVPADAEIPSHRLMIRAGLMRKAAGGIYSFLPLGWRVITKVSQIIREEMNRVGGQELMLPILQPADVWQQTGRWSDYGEEMFRVTDRHGRSFCLGPTHEEVVTDLVQREVRSYKQLPLTVYQIQNKYRDEVRPRFGVMRSREFIMKDAYSFDMDEAGLRRTYEQMHEAYSRIFARCALESWPVMAFAGAIGGDYNHEFVVPADTGEAEILRCTGCGYAANNEMAEVRRDESEPRAYTDQAVEEVETPGASTIAQLESFLERSARDMIKTLIYVADDKPVAVLVRGDREVNEAKVAQLVGAAQVEPADPLYVEELTGAPIGYLGPVGLTGMRIIADPEVLMIEDGITGGNKRDAHLIHVAYGRDYTVDETADVRFATEDDPCPRCGEGVTLQRGIELGHIFQLGTKYSRALDAVYLDEGGREQPMIMGCYGIGVTRTVAAVIECHRDDDGIIWPMSVAPFHVHLIMINPKDEAQAEAAEGLYEALNDLGVETILDDRDERPGVKFNDADLIGFPLRVTVGPRSLATDSVEVRDRRTKEEWTVPLDEASSWLRQRIDAGMKWGE